MPKPTIVGTRKDGERGLANWRSTMVLEKRGGRRVTMARTQ